MPEIMRATVADAPEILVLQKLAYLSEAELYNDYTIPPLTQTIEEISADFERKMFLKAVTDGRIVGSVNGFLKDDRCLIGRLMVHADFQGRGIGARLLMAVEELFAGARAWELFTGELSANNIRLYQRLGYRISRTESFPGSRYAVVFLEKTPELAEIREKMRPFADPRQARLLQRYFKTGPGEYGAGDVFLGLRVPQVRKLAKEFRSLSLSKTLWLLQSPIHEERLLALLVFIRNYGRGNAATREKIFVTYLENTRFINNWDLVDISAGQIVGPHLNDGGRDTLDSLAESASLWERRIAIMATSHYIRQGDFSDTLRIARKLLHDPEDLIHKAVGWMLREIGKRDFTAEEAFLKNTYRVMPRTMLRYAIEKFPEELRRKYLRR